MAGDIESNAMFQQAGEAIASSSPVRELVTRLLTEAVELESHIEELDDLIKSAKARLQLLRTKDIPDAMARLGSTEFLGDDMDDDGKVFKVSIDDFVYGTLPKEEPARQKAIDWIEQHDGAGLMKTTVELVFGKSEHNVAMDLVGRLREEGHEVGVESGVHPQTLLAYARERLRAGEDVDLPLLGLGSGRAAKISKVKAKKRLHKGAK